MSADRYSMCPKCAKNEENKRLAKEVEIESFYGKIPLQEFQKRLAKTAAPVQLEETLREDYYLGLEGSVLEISYHCACRDCGFKFSISEKRSILEGQP